MNLASLTFLAASAFAAVIADDRPEAERVGREESFRAALGATEAKTWESPEGGTLPYRLHVPAKPEPGRLYPLVVHMHGAGSRGTNNLDQIRNGGADFILWAKRRGEEFVFLAPQCPAERKWVDSSQRAMKATPTPYMRMAIEIIDDAIKRYPVDLNRIYVMGISMGGYATWELCERRSELFAAALPCCGGGDPSLASRMANIPIWAFHGDMDESVPVSRSRDMVAAIKAAGGTKVKYREYAGKGHNVWTPTFSDDSVFDWLFSQRKGWYVGSWEGAPLLFHDGSPVTPLLFWQWEMQEQDAKAMEDAGVNLFSMFGSHIAYDHPFFVKGGFGGLGYKERNLDDLLKWVPSAAFLPRLFYAAPEWWIAEHPEECIKYLNPNVVEPLPEVRKGSVPRESFASELFRREFEPSYRAAVKRLCEKYGDHLMGIHVCGGVFGENHAWDTLTQIPTGPVGPIETFGFGDGSKPMTERFRRFLREKYGRDFPDAEVPTMEERLNVDVDGAWRDPAKSRRIIDFFECLHRTTLDNIVHYTRIVKEESCGALPTMMFYGYIPDFRFTVECDHRAISQTLGVKTLDMLSAPHTYARRGLGEDGQPRAYLASVALHGKFFVDEGDDRTHLQLLKDPPESSFATNADETRALLLREFGMSVTHGVGLWYMDIGRDNFRDADILKTIAQVKKASKASLRHDRSHVSQIAIVSNPESEFYLGYRGTEANNVCHACYIDQMRMLYRSGAPFDWYLADDLDAVVDRNYRVVVFLDCQYMTERQTALVERLKSGGRTLVFFHAPGYVSENGLSRERMERICGITMRSGTVRGLVAENSFQRGLFLPAEGETLACGFGDLSETPVVVRRRMDGYSTVFASIPCLSPSLLRSLYRDSGVHVYTDQEVVMSTNGTWLMLHTDHADDYEVKLPRLCPRVIDVTDGHDVSRNSDRFVRALPKYSTAVYLMDWRGVEGDWR